MSAGLQVQAVGKQEALRGYGFDRRAHGGAAGLQARCKYDGQSEAWQRRPKRGDGTAMNVLIFRGQAD